MKEVFDITLIVIACVLGLILWIGELASLIESIRRRKNNKQ